MTWNFPARFIPAVIAGLLVQGCAHHSAESRAQFVCGESAVLAGAAPATLAFPPLLSRPVDVRSTYRSNLADTVHYSPDRDYIIEASGQIRRTPGSRIPDFATNILYGKEEFRHDQFPGFGNNRFFVYIDYFRAASPGHDGPAQSLVGDSSGAALLPRTLEKLKAGQTIRLVAFGDSITAGGEASDPHLIFWQRWADDLQVKYPQARIETINGATGGDSTAQGLQRLEEKVLRQKPDLVVIGFGMNDHNREGYGVPLNAFADNLRTLIDRIRSATSAEIVLCSAFPPNPKWYFGSHNMEAYAKMTGQIAQEKQCAFADVYRRWMPYLERKKPEDLLANNINHPNDFGHWIYFCAFRDLGL
jgi:acyl-CoA thioesterase I